MERKWRYAVALTIIAMILVSATLVATSRAPYVISYKIVEVTKISNKGPEAYKLTQEDKRFLLSFNNSWQILYLDREKIGYRILKYERDIDNNTIAVFDLPDILAPQEELVIELTYYGHVRLKEIAKVELDKSGDLKDISSHLKEAYARPVGSWRYDNWSELKELALSIAGNETNVLKIVYSFVSWIRANIAYESPDLPRYPNETYRLRAGDCDDQSNLLIVLCRAIEIPAHLQVGAVYLPGRKEDTQINHLRFREENIGFHGWAMVYIPPWGWIPVDPVWRYDLVDPSTSITHSAISKVWTLALLNILYTDYIRDAKEYLSRLEYHNLYLENAYSMNVYMEVDYPLVIGSALGLVVLAIGVIGLYVIIGRWKGSLESRESRS